MSKLADKLLTECPEQQYNDQTFGGHTKIRTIIQSDTTKYANKIVTVCGWAKSIRKQGKGKFCFVILNDGSTADNFQVVVDEGIEGYEEICKGSSGYSFKFVGTVILPESTSEEKLELLVKDPTKHSCTIYGKADATKYPLSKKQHGKDFLREIAHLRPRTYYISAIARLRSQLAMATHRFFQDRGFTYIHTPIITSADCEGVGEMFQVTTIFKDKINDIPQVGGQEGIVDFKKEFFARPTYLTVSGQLSVENFCCAMGDVYTFGPTFRAENSHTSRHLAEFWMIEPELAFTDLFGLMECAESYLKYCIAWALVNCKSDMDWFEKNLEAGVIERLKAALKEDFHRITYTDAIEVLKKYQDKFSVHVEWGIDLGTEHERFLTEEIYKKPVIIYNYPKSFKAFYMRQNEDGRTVRAMDVLLPKVGEVIGGSQREERLEKLDAMIKEKQLDIDSYWWYRELRQYGTVPHSGFGLGFERLIMAISGAQNIRDVIPFPRYPGHAEF